MHSKRQTITKYIYKEPVRVVSIDCKGVELYPNMSIMLLHKVRHILCIFKILRS